jgi:hypothetical protein
MELPAGWRYTTLHRGLSGGLAGFSLPSEARATCSNVSHNTPAGRRAEAARQRRRNQRLEQYEQAGKRKQQGLPQPMMAHQVGVSKRTLTRWGKAETFPERQRRHGDRHSLSPYTTYVQQRWAEGCRNAMHLWRELRKQGFTGSSARVASSVAP